MKLLISSFLMLSLACSAQNGFKTGERVPDIIARKLLNYSENSSSLKNLQGNITIIDFFGTWCAPCIKALPELKEYQNKFKEDLRILLVSNEEESKLSRFINMHQPFSFPVVVDEEKLFTNAFKPPAYPYTVVLDKNLKILSITNAADLTASMLDQFIKDGKLISESKTAVSSISIKTETPMKSFTESSNELVKLSQDFMYAAKTNEDAGSYISRLKQLKYNELISNLNTDDEKKAFWINLYNAFTNWSLHKDPEQYKSRNRFFKNKNISIAGKLFSLDKIEHGILRRSKIKWSLGYFGKLFPGKTEKDLRVEKVDYRIHFALNCGAKSCPPIAFYTPDMLSKQLDMATTVYLTNEAIYTKENNTLQLPALMSWFRRDFGGKKKMIELLKAEQLIPQDVNPKIKFKNYDWSLFLDNFKN